MLHQTLIIMHRDILQFNFTAMFNKLCSDMSSFKLSALNLCSVLLLSHNSYIHLVLCFVGQVPNYMKTPTGLSEPQTPEREGESLNHNYLSLIYSSQWNVFGLY